MKRIINIKAVFGKIAVCSAITGMLLSACSKDIGGEEIEGGEIKINTAIGELKNVDTKAPIVDGAGATAKISLSNVKFLHAQVTGTAAPAGFDAQTPVNATRATSGDITFDVMQKYDNTGKRSWLVGLYPGAATDATVSTTKIDWVIDGKKDILATPMWDAGNNANQKTAGMVFDHQLAQLEVICRAKSGATLADVQAAWGNITKNELGAPSPTATYPYATNTMGYAGTAADYTLLRSDSNSAFAFLRLVCLASSRRCVGVTHSSLSAHRNTQI